MKPQFSIKISFAVLSLIVAALACDFSLSTAKVENVRLARDERGDNLASEFNQEDTIYLLGELKNAPDDTKLKMTVTAVDVYGVEPETAIDEAELSTGDGTFVINLQYRDKSVWAPGSYRVDLFLNDKINHSATFLVKQTIEAEIQDLALSASQTGSPETNTFHPNETWYLVGTLVDSPAESTIKVVWSAVNTNGTLPNGVINEEEKQFETGLFEFSSSREKAWPAGEYSVDIYLNAILVKTITFSVEIEGPIAQSVKMALDQNGTEATLVFGLEAPFYLIADIQGAPADGVPVKVDWYYLQDALENRKRKLITTYEGTAENGPFWASLTSNTGTWEVGRYEADFWLDEKLIQTLSFDVSKDGPVSSISMSPEIKNIYLSLDADGNKKTNVFSPNDTFHVGGEIVNAAGSVTVESNWMAEEVKGFTANEVISEPQEFSFENGGFTISLANDQSKWTPGKYQVELLLNGDLVGSPSFLVTTIRVEDPHMATDKDDTSRVTSYKTDQRFYLIFNLKDAPQNTTISTTLERLGATEDEDVKLLDSSYTFGTGSYYIEFSSDSGIWDVGDYVVDIFLNNYYYTSVFFDVK